MKLASRVILLVLPILCGCGGEGVTSTKPPTDTTSKAPVDTVVLQNLPLVFDVENTGASFGKPVFPAFAQLKVDTVLPDPFRSFAGSLDLTYAGWSRRRAEIEAAIEEYEIGPKPDPADVDVKATYARDTLTVTVTRKSNGKSLTLRAKVTLPAGAGPFPAVIGMNSPTGSLPPDLFTSRSVATIPYYHDQVTRYVMSGDPGHESDPYFLLYPEYAANGAVGQYSAWSWGVSRLIDGVVLAARAGTLPIDVAHLAVTGCSYAGKMALFAGALDERVALTIAQESGGGGAPAWRASHALEPNGTVEKIDNTNYTWFRRGMQTFGGDNVYRLPEDHHELMALVAPRALLVTGNTNYTWLSNRSAYVSARATREVFRTLGIPDRFGFYIDGGHNHCEIPTGQRPAIGAFIDRFLLGQSVGTDIQVQPFSDVDYRPWIRWTR